MTSRAWISKFQVKPQFLCANFLGLQTYIFDLMSAINYSTVALCMYLTNEFGFVSDVHEYVLFHLNVLPLVDTLSSPLKTEWTLSPIRFKPTAYNWIHLIICIPSTRLLEIFLPCLAYHNVYLFVFMALCSRLLILQRTWKRTLVIEGIDKPIYSYFDLQRPGFTLLTRRDKWVNSLFSSVTSVSLFVAVCDDPLRIINVTPKQSELLWQPIESYYFQFRIDFVKTTYRSLLINLVTQFEAQVYLLSPILMRLCKFLLYF